jgi:hypothetical protein
MAKELPYFKFEPNEWENGNIQICTHEEKGVFTDLCSMYWSRLGDVSYKLAVQKICGGNANALDSLHENKIFEVIDGNIYIKYLSEQLNEFENTSERNSKIAKEGWEKRRKQKETSERNANALRTQSESNAIREDEIREDKIINISFDVFWNLYNKKKGDKDKCEGKWNKLKNEERQKIIDTLPTFLKSITDKKYQPYPERYLNNKRWNDEISISEQSEVKFKCEDMNAFGWFYPMLTQSEFDERIKINPHLKKL